MADTCPELAAFRIATESLQDNVLNSPMYARANYFRNIFPAGEFVKNQGVERTGFQIKPSAPSDDQTKWQTVTNLGTGLTSPGCNPLYEDIGVGFFEFKWGPKRRDFRGPVFCKEHFEFQHSVDQFVSGYVKQMRQWLALTWEFGLRGDVMRLGDWFVDGVKYVGPNAVATAPKAFQGLSLDMLEQVAQDRINIGVTAGTDNGDYVLNGAAGPIYPLFINMVESQKILNSNPLVREDAHFASMGTDGKGNFGLWQALGASRQIGNFRYIPTNIEPRFNYTNGYIPVTPFKDITVVGTDQEILTTAYKNAPYAAALVAVPSGMRIEAVRPQNAGLDFNMSNYNGDLEFVVGGYRICDPPVHDPRGEKGRHYATIQYAAAPVYPHNLATIIYKRCPATDSRIFCS